MARMPTDDDAVPEEEDDIGPDEVTDEDDAELQDDDNPDADADLAAADETDDLDTPPEQPKKPISRGERRFQSLSKRTAQAEREAREAREQLARLSGSVETLSRQPRDTAAERAAEQERINAMSEREYADYRLAQEKQTIAQAFQQQGFATQDKMDRMDFRDLCRENPRLKSVSEETERRLGDLRKQGGNVDRLVMARQILGERAEAAEKRGNQQRRAPADQVRRKAPPSSGSDVQPERNDRGRKGESPKDKLSRLNVTF